MRLQKYENKKVLVCIFFLPVCNIPALLAFSFLLDYYVSFKIIPK